MKKILATVILAAFAALPAAAQERAPKCGDCGTETYGTTVVWAGTPAEAAKRALEEKKLVFVLHVSGNFEDPGLT